jgi:Family of unknown function (DUF6622)
MTSPLAILTHTPWWAFVIFALLVARGVTGLTPRSVPVVRLMIVPAVFVAWGIASLAMRSTGSPLLVADWLACAAAGLAIGWQTTRLDGIRIDRAAGLVMVPGSIVPLLRNLLIFLTKYALAVAMTMAPAWRADIVSWDVAVSGLSAGYFIAWMLRFALRYRGHAPGTAVAQPQKRRALTVAVRALSGATRR